MRLRVWMMMCGAAGFALGAAMPAQNLPLTQAFKANALTPLDASRTVRSPELERTIHQPLPEEYIWTAPDVATKTRLVYRSPGINEGTEPHFFRAHFEVKHVPRAATLYLAGPRSADVWINGQLAQHANSDTQSPLGMHVFAAPVARLLHPGANVIAIRAVRGRGVAGFANSALVQQQTSGRVLVAKILAADEGVVAPAIMHSDGSWRSSATQAEGWEQPRFQDAGWKPVMSLGGIESNIELFQWNADAGLYDWPGYDGLSGFLAHMPLAVHKVMHVYAGSGKVEGVESLTTGSGTVNIAMPTGQWSDKDAPSFTIDFGRELTGRLEIVSDSDRPVTLTMQMGESESEALKAPYLGVNQVTIAPHGTAHSAKTAFRYAKVRVLSGGPEVRLKTIRADHVFYPVQYAGSFESSDPVLNHIWETGAYTAHLCMQDGVWDAPKRDRGRWMGDTDVSGPVIEDVFGEKTLLEDTLDRLLGPDASVPVDQHVNGIPGYSSFWFTGVADFYRHSGDRAFLEREHQRMLQLLDVVDREFDERNIYANKSKVWLYVDWSPELNGDTPETRRATTLEFLRAYREAVFLLRDLGDTANADKYAARADAIEQSSRKLLAEGETFGPRWQTNAAAVLSGAATPAQYDAIWKRVLSQVGQPAPAGTAWPIMSPYYGAYVLRAMARMNHRAEALHWMRQYWGGMLAEGATSFWEAYDPSWYKGDFHASLQADNGSGYFVSLAHGWAAGPTAWLMEEVLGVQPTAAGFSSVRIRPDLVDLEWAKGAMPTPHGLLTVNVRKSGQGMALVLEVPEGIKASVIVPVQNGVDQVKVNGQTMESQAAGEPGRRVVVLEKAGRYTIGD